MKKTKMTKKISSTDVPSSISREIYYQRWKKAFEDAVLMGGAEVIIRSGEIANFDDKEKDDGSGD
jgi:hypothetical protein